MSETIIGTCSEVSERGDWTTFHVDIGKQYPVKLSTKKAELVELGRAAARDAGEFAWTYNEVESEKINEHTGKPFVNRYLESVAKHAPDANATQSAPSTSGNDAMTKEEWARKDSAIHKMACIKVAAAVLTHTLPADPTLEDLNKFGERVSILSGRWHRVVLAVRDDPTGEDVPFE